MNGRTLVGLKTFRVFQVSSLSFTFLTCLYPRYTMWRFLGRMVNYLELEMEVENSSTVRLQILLILSHWKTWEDALSYCANEHAPTRNFTSDRLGFFFPFLFRHVFVDEFQRIEHLEEGYGNLLSFSICEHVQSANIIQVAHQICPNKLWLCAERSLIYKQQLANCNWPEVAIFGPALKNRYHCGRKKPLLLSHLFFSQHINNRHWRWISVGQRCSWLPLPHCPSWYNRMLNIRGSLSAQVIPIL